MREGGEVNFEIKHQANLQKAIGILAQMEKLKKGLLKASKRSNNSAMMASNLVPDIEFYIDAFKKKRNLS